MMIDDYKLIDVTDKHKDFIYRWRNSNHIRKYMFTDRLITREEHDLWFDRVKKNNAQINGIINRPIAKILHYQEQPIGFINFTDIDQENNKCSWGFYIGEENAPKGSGQIMGFLSLNHIFEEFKLRKLCAEVLGFNERSIRYHRKLGFIEEGRLKEHVFKHDRYVDVILMALFHDQWAKRKVHLAVRPNPM